MSFTALALTLIASYGSIAANGVPANALLDETGDPILDESGDYILDET